MSVSLFISISLHVQSTTVAPRFEHSFNHFPVVESFPLPQEVVAVSVPLANPDFKHLVHCALSLRYPASKILLAKVIALSAVSVSSATQRSLAISSIVFFRYLVCRSATISLQTSTHSMQMLRPGPTMGLSSLVICLQKLHTVFGSGSRRGICCHLYTSL